MLEMGARSPEVHTERQERQQTTGCAAAKLDAAASQAISLSVNRCPVSCDNKGGLMEPYREEELARARPPIHPRISESEQVQQKTRVPLRTRFCKTGCLHYEWQII